MAELRLRSWRSHSAVAAVALSCLLLRPTAAIAAVTFAWMPSDGSNSSGTLTIDVPDSGHFSVSSTTITALEFTFGPGVSVRLVAPASDGGTPVMSFDGSGLDYGGVGVNWPTDAIFSFSPEQLGADVAMYVRDRTYPIDPPRIRLTGQWVRTDIVSPPKPPHRIGLLGILDVRSILARHHNVGNVSGVAYNAAADVIYLSHGSDPSGAFIYTLDSSGNFLGELNLQAVYRPGVWPNSLSYDDATGHLFVEVREFVGNVAQTTIVEMDADGSTIFREVPLPGPAGYSMVRTDGIWQPAVDTIRHYTMDGELVEQLSVKASFPPGAGPLALTSAIDDPTGGFVLVGHSRQRLVQVAGDGREVSAVPTVTLADPVSGDGRGSAIASDPATRRIFLVGDSERIFILSAGFMQTRLVNDLLRLGSEPVVRWDRTPVPRGSWGTFRLTATFENTSDQDVCGLFFLADVSSNGQRIHQFDSVAIEPGGEWLEAYDQMTTGHRQFDLRAHQSVTLTFTIDLQGPHWFDFFVNAWGVPRPPASTCGQ